MIEFTNVYEMRMNEGKSISTLARDIGVSQNVLDRFERNESLRETSLKKIADYFQVTVMELLISKKTTPRDIF
jgi:ribosome-binding protein aMBF1 (putative translation factor)